MVTRSMLLTLALSCAATAFAAEPPAAGAAAPEFTLASQDGRPVSLKDLRGRWVVLYFYPKDFTRGCTIEAHEFQKNLPRFRKAGAVILGVSMQSVESHKEFCAKEGLAFKLLADTTGEVSKAYGSTLAAPLGLSARNTFLIAPDGTIAASFLKVSPAGHADEVLRAIAAAKRRP